MTSSFESFAILLFCILGTFSNSIIFALTMRYVEDIIERDKLSEFEEVIMDEIGYLGCAQEIYN